MSKALLVTRPAYDPVTKYLHHWSKNLIDMAVDKSIDVHDLEAEKADRKNFESYVNKHEPTLIVLNGHGNATCVTGSNEEPLVDMTSHIISSVMYARSCDAGMQLGPELINKGTKCFIGYKRRFTFMTYIDKSSKPLEDNLAALFIEPSNLVVSTLLKGHSAKQAYIRSQKAMRKNFRKMVSSSASYEERYAAKWLWANIKSQVLLGDSTSKI